MQMENQTTEFKREYVEDIKKTVIAFANCDGGTIFIGRNDDGSICGVEDVDSTMLQVTNAIRDAICPDVTMFVSCQTESMDGKAVICVTVHRGTARPYYLSGKGIRPAGVYVRQGASTVPATETAILHMIKETSGDSYEVARSIQQQLTFEKTAAFFEKENIPFGKTQMRTLHVIGEDETYTNLGFLLSEQCSHTIKIAVFEGSQKTVFKDRCEFTGSLLSQLEEAFSYIDRFNRTRAEFSGLHRIDMRDYPPEAVREALLNAIVHREYSFHASTLISIFDDRMEIVSIGGLIKGLSLDDIMLGVSVLRNPNLANLFYRLHLIEAYGTGILKIKECYGDGPVTPDILVTNNAFKIVLPNTNYYKEHKAYRLEETAAVYSAPKHTRETTILKLCQKNGSVNRKEVQTALGLSQSMTILILREMVETGLLYTKGNARNLRYYTNEQKHDMISHNSNQNAR